MWDSARAAMVRRSNNIHHRPDRNASSHASPAGHGCPGSRVGVFGRVAATVIGRRRCACAGQSGPGCPMRATALPKVARRCCRKIGQQPGEQQAEAAIRRVKPLWCALSEAIMTKRRSCAPCLIHHKVPGDGHPFTFDTNQCRRLWLHQHCRFVADGMSAVQSGSPAWPSP